VALKAIVETLEEVAEPLREHYTLREDGKYILGAEGAEEVYAGGLIKNRDDILAEKRELEKKIKAAEGVDIEEYNRLKAAQEEAQRKKDEETGNFRNLEKQLIEKHTKEKDTLVARTNTLKSALDKELVEAKLTAEITTQKGVPALLLPVISQSVRVFEDEVTGQFVPRVIDPATGQPRIGDTKGTPMTIKQLVSEYKANETFGRAFEATGAGGSGAAHNNNSSGSSAVRLTREQAKDPSIYRAARDRAASLGTTVQFIE